MSDPAKYEGRGDPRQISPRINRARSIPDSASAYCGCVDTNAIPDS